MSDFFSEVPLNIVEIPPELRGLSDEEIIARSEKPLKEISGKRKKGERRPSKRVRMAMKQERALLDAQNSAAKLFIATNQAVKKEQSLDVPHKQALITEKSRPSSGRILKASFGGKPIEKTKAEAISVAELARQRTEERAKKIREALLTKKSTTEKV